MGHPVVGRIWESNQDLVNPPVSRQSILEQDTELQITPDKQPLPASAISV